MIELPPDLVRMLAIVLVLYTAALFGLAWWARGRIHDHEDYLVAGRSLSFPLATATLFATWFGAGTLLAAADEVRSEGLAAAALDPLGAGTCLLLAGLFFAAPLWRMKLLTLSDFFACRFGARAERLSAILIVPGYTGWIAAQFVALAAMLELYFGLDARLGILLVAAIGTGYTLLGGMWSVTLTDALQLGLLVVGLVTLAVGVLVELGGPLVGVLRIVDETPASMLQPIPVDALAPFLGWLGLFCAGALGNLPGQDLTQRIFSARSANVARAACLCAGIGYLVLGCAPIMLGLAANLLLPESQATSILPALASLFMNPWVAVIFVVTLMSAVLSTIDSALLAPASVIANNLVRRGGEGAASLSVDRWAVFGVAVCSTGVALLGENAYSLLEGAYEIGLVSLLIPLAFGLASPRGGEGAALAAMGVGTGLWGVHQLAGFEWFAEPWLAEAGIPLPVGLSCAAIAAGVYWGWAQLAGGVEESG